MYIQFFAFILIFLPSTVFAQNYLGDVWSSPRTFSIDFQYVNYSDIVHNPNNSMATLNQTVGVNLNARFYRIFSLVGTYAKSPKPDWSYYGLGLKIDLPGFFFISGISYDFVRRKKNQPVNTYVIIEKLMATQSGQKDSFIDDKLGGGVDIAMSSHVYLNLEVALLSHQGNQFFAPAIGIGYEF
jgi:hypothetical protein